MKELEIAIIGLAGRFPGAADPRALWRNLVGGRESTRFLTPAELTRSGVPEAARKAPGHVAAAGVLDDVELFDAEFFGIVPKEAREMDPQHRLFLQCAWEALEDAGYDPSRHDGSIGVWAGSSTNTYLLFNLLPTLELGADSLELTQARLAAGSSALTTRVSYRLNLTGPSVFVQTACSTSLVAVHLACQDLLGYRCDLALAGGVTVNVRQKQGYLYTDEGIFSRDGRCRAFDEKADGMLPGNGAGIVVLKRLEEAIADRDHIYAVVKGSAINNDGTQKIGFTAPSVQGQAEVVAAALRIADVAPETVGYIEAHGTATPLGDMVEISALKQVFAPSAARAGACGIGSVKTNFGHLDAAAGVAGLIKTALALEHRRIPASLHFTTPNPRLGLEGSPFRVVAQTTEWESAGGPRRAGVSSFGLGGTNAHVVLEEAPQPPPPPPARPCHLLVVSARTRDALDRASARLAEFLRESPELQAGDVAATLALGRKAFAHRRAVVGADLAAGAEALVRGGPGAVMDGVAPEKPPGVVFLFSGQGAQHPGMARELYEHQPLFRAEVDRCAERLREHLDEDIREVLFAGADGAASRIHQTPLALPALFVTQLALARLWMRLGVRPRALLGNSLGEYTAACLAGVFSLEDALAVVAARARLMGRTAEGAMLSVPLSEQEIAPSLAADAWVAVASSPTSCVVAGTPEGVARLEDRLRPILEARGVEAQRLLGSRASHCPLVEPILAPFGDVLSRVRLQPPRIPFVSNLSGGWARAEEVTDAQYWLRHLRQTVRLSEGFAALRALEGPGLWIEVGPGRAMAAAARSSGDAPAVPVLASLGHPRDPRSDLEMFLGAVAQAWIGGAAIDWGALYRHEPWRRVPLPTYPFERQRHWIDAPAPAARERAAAASAPTARRPSGGGSRLLAPFWRPSVLDPAAPAAAPEASSVLVLGSKAALGELDEVIRRLRERGVVITAQWGPRPRRLAEQAWEIAPSGVEGLGELVRALAAEGLRPGRALVPWGEPGAGVDEDAAPDACLDRLADAAAVLAESAVPLWVLTRGACDVSGCEPTPWPEAAAAGAVQALRERAAPFAVGLVDLPARELGAAAWDPGALAAELRGSGPEPVVALRGRVRWTPDPQAVPSPAADAVLRPDGRYVIAGACEPAGFAVARSLAERGAAGLLLVEDARGSGGGLDTAWELGEL